jgi:hypothetical protein
MPDEECFSHKNMRFPQAGGLRDQGSVAILRKSQQGAATNNGSGLQTRDDYVTLGKLKQSSGASGGQ